MRSLSDAGGINNNQLLRQTQDSLNQVNKEAELHRLRLATGKKINEASNDPAGFVIGRTLQARNKGLATALANTSDGRSALSVAEGGLSGILDLLDRMKAKATQAASDTLSEEGRHAINLELAALADEIDDIAGGTTYNDKQLLNGQSLDLQVGEGPGDQETFTVTDGAHDTAGLGVGKSAIQAGSAGAAGDAMQAIEQAARHVRKSIGSIGASQARLASKEDSLVQAITNGEAARSRIMDADLAREQMDSLALQLRQEAATGAHAHASSQSLSAL